LTAGVARTLTLSSDGFWISPYVFACYVALREKAARFEVKEVKLQAGEQRSPEYRATTWTGRVPALTDGDFALTESIAILEYLEETFAPPAHARLFPADVKTKARARQLMSWLRSDATAPIRAERSAEVIFYERPLPPLTPAALAAVDKMKELLGHFVSSDDGLLPGALRGYAETQWRRPSVAEWVGHPRAADFVPYG